MVSYWYWLILIFDDILKYIWWYIDVSWNEATPKNMDGFWWKVPWKLMRKRAIPKMVHPPKIDFPRWVRSGDSPQYLAIDRWSVIILRTWRCPVGVPVLVIPSHHPFFGNVRKNPAATVWGSPMAKWKHRSDGDNDGWYRCINVRDGIIVNSWYSYHLWI